LHLYLGLGHTAAVSPEKDRAHHILGAVIALGRHKRFGRDFRTIDAFEMTNGVASQRANCHGKTAFEDIENVGPANKTDQQLVADALANVAPAVFGDTAYPSSHLPIDPFQQGSHDGLIA